MADEKSTFTKSFEELLGKSIEANKIFINEGTRVFQQMANGKKNDFNLFQNETITNAVKEYVNLNISHFNKLVDLGLNMVKEFGKAGTGEKKEPAAPDVSSPDFILEKISEPGSQITFQFLLDNVKKEVVTCHLVHSGFCLQQDPDVMYPFEIGFNPQAFELKPGESKPVNIHIKIPENTLPGFYYCKVQVKGFEPSYFAIQLTITAKQNTPNKNVGKKAKPKRK